MRRIVVLLVMCALGWPSMAVAAETQSRAVAGRVKMEAEYILACQYLRDGDPASGAINNVHGDPT